MRRCGRSRARSLAGQAMPSRRTASQRSRNRVAQGAAPRAGRFYALAATRRKSTSLMLTPGAAQLLADEADGVPAPRSRTRQTRSRRRRRAIAGSPATKPGAERSLGRMSRVSALAAAGAWSRVDRQRHECCVHVFSVSWRFSRLSWRFSRRCQSVGPGCDAEVIGLRLEGAPCPSASRGCPRARAEHRQVVSFRITDRESRPQAQPLDEGSF